MKNFLFLALLILASTAFGQDLRKKFYGTYEGVIPAYKLDIGGEVVDVKSVRIKIEIQEGEITQDIGNTSKKGTWKIVFEGKSYFILSAALDGQTIEERIIVYKKGHKLSREGIYPQPAAELTKIEGPSGGTQKRGVRYKQ